MLTGQGRGNDFLLLGQAAPLPFFYLSSLPLPSPFPSLSIPSFRSRPLLLPFHNFHFLLFTFKLPISNTITTTTHRYGSEMVVCKMRLRVRNALLHKLGFVQPPYFYTPWYSHMSCVPTEIRFIFDEHLTFSDQISPLSKSCYHHIRALRCIRLYIDLHTAKKQLPPPLYTPNLTIVTLCTMGYRNFK